MSAPSGTVTLLFTDIEGSTALLERLRERYADVLEGQRGVLRDCFARWAGHEVDTQGDSFFVAFATAHDALRCAIDAQRRLARYEWPDGAAVRVRMGVHTGEPLVASTGYVGIDVHRAARIGAAAHGGQVLLSQRTRQSVDDDLGHEVSFVSVGVQRFKGLSEPIEVLQLAASGLQTGFGPIGAGAPEEEPPAPGSAPYKGLLRFDERDAPLFFGRERASEQIVQLLERERLLAVVGASGSGKSSIVRAGLIPLLKSRTAKRWRTYVLTPTADPMAALSELARQPVDASMANLASSVRKRARGADAILIVVDQFEELFTLCHDEEQRQAFIDQLLSAAADSGEPPIRVLITLRADFYARLAPYPALRDAVAQRQVYVGPMEPEDLRRAIEEPASRNGWLIAPGLVDLLLRDVGREPGNLPLLSHALLETWRRRRGKTLSLRGYFEAGEVSGAIARTADRVYGRLSDEQRASVRQIMLRLTEVGEEAATRRRAELNELIPHGASADVANTVLRRLVDARLVTVDEGNAEVAHEALIREWPLLREWLSEDREGLRTHRQLTDAAREWLSMGRDDSALYRGARLATAHEWAAANAGVLNELEQAFLDASTELEQREEIEREEQRQRELEAAQRAAEAERRRAEDQASSARRLRRRAVVLGVTGVLALVAAVAAVFLGFQAQASATRAQARELASAAEANLEIDPERSVLLATRAVQLGRGDSSEPLPEAVEALHRAVVASRAVATFTGHDGAVVGAATNADGSLSATLSVDGTLRLWDQMGAEVRQFPVAAPIPDQTTTLAFAGDGKLYVPNGPDVTELDATSGATRAFAGPPSTDADPVSVTSVDVSDDGSLLVRGATDGTVALYDRALGTMIRTITISAGSGGCSPPEEPKPCPVIAVALSADESRLAVGTFGMPTAHVVDLTTDETIASFEHGDVVGAIELSADANYLVAGGWDTVTTVWDLGTQTPAYSLFTHRSLINGLDIDKSGRLVTASADGSVRLVELATGRELGAIPAHSSAVFAARFSADGNRLVTSSGDGTASMWDVSSTAGAELALMPTHDRAFSVAYLPNGAVATGTVFDGQLAIWDAATGRQLAATATGLGPMDDIFVLGDDVYVLEAGELVRYDAQAVELDRWPAIERATSAGASADGRLVAFGWESGAEVFELATRRHLFSVGGFELGVGSVSFSPDASVLGVAGQDGHAVLVDVATGAIRANLGDHTGAVQVITFSPDGKLAVTGSNDATAKVWNVVDGTLLHTLTGHVSPIYGLDFTADGTLLATGSIDSTIKLWKVADFAARPLTLRGHTAAVYDVEFSPDGKHLVSGSRDRTGRVFAVDVAELLAIAADRVTRELTTAECRQYLHVAACPEH